MSPGDGQTILFIIYLFVVPLIVLSILGLLIAMFVVKSNRGRWFAWPAKSLIALICIVTLDIPLKLTSLAIHCAFWTGFHVEPGKIVTGTAGEWCDSACVQALVARAEPVVVRTVTYPQTRWNAGETWDLSFRLTNEDWYSCREEWEKVRVAASSNGVTVPPDPERCLRYQRVEGQERSPLYELRDEIDQTNPESISWLTFKRGFEVWDIQTDRMIAWFRGYDIRLSWLYPLELGCPVDRALMTDRVVVLEPIKP